MKSIDELKREQSAAIVRLEREHAIANACPIPPHSVMEGGKRAAWIGYRVKTLVEAAQVMCAFTVVRSEVWRYGSTSICPESEVSTRDRERAVSNSGDFACWIDVSQGKGFGPNAKLVFFARISTGVVRVSVDFGAGYIDTCHQLAASRKVERDGRGCVVASSFSPNAEANGASDKLIKWGTGNTGPIENSAQFSYLFCADQSDDTPGAECKHALAQLAILAERAKV